jgi:hypothetical protein
MSEADTKMAPEMTSTTRERPLKIGQHLLTAAAFVALATNICLAENDGHTSKEIVGAPHFDETATSLSKANGLASPSAYHGDDRSSSGARDGGAAQIREGTNGTDHRPAEQGGARKTAGGGGVSKGADTNPIDTSITVQLDRPRSSPTKALDFKKTAAPSRTTHSVPGAMDGGARNAIGVRVEDKLGSKGTDAGHQASGSVVNVGTSTKATGNAAKDSVGGRGPDIGHPGGASAMPPATIGAAQDVAGGANEPRIGHQASGPGVTGGAQGIPAGINGTGMGRPGSGPGTIGGPTKNIVSINGAAIRLKR